MPDALHELCAQLLEHADNPREGLPPDVFRLVSQLTPLVNVDLLIHDESGQTLLTWRADEFYGPGWHIPGGIVRFKESLATRIAKVADLELGCTVDFDPKPIAMNEITHPRRNVRGHFISFLYTCRLNSEPDEKLKFHGKIPLNGQWQWCDRCPDPLIPVHERYRDFINHAQSSHECA
jgi:colanic acid biosynthesis protein WcaH